jgi:hypothetical protein
MNFGTILKQFTGFLPIFILFSCQSDTLPEWPEITSQTKPWTRWWWMGSAVNPTDLSYCLEQYAKTGLGGVEISPIYGVKGYEKEFIEYLSPEWTNMLTYTLNEAKKYDLGVDMTTGTGWPFGGPWVTSEEACKYMTYKVYELSGGEKLSEPLLCIQKPIARAIGKKIQISELAEPVSRNNNLQQLALEQIRFQKNLPLVVLMAYGQDGEILDITDRVDGEGKLDWIAPAGNWKLFAIFQGWHGKIVERAAPGGEGDVIDHFSEEAIKQYLGEFDNAFMRHEINSLRAFFNDSYEVDDAIGEANFTPDLFNEFKLRRGYDLRNFLPALFGQDTAVKKNMRILHDYRLTISELLLENFMLPWKEWAWNKGAIVRNQAHGSPANILDLYAAADIPETEGNNIYFNKYASSAGNISGKKLISSETATWLDEHFQTSLAEVKSDIDRLFLGGINHIIYHGTPYSPKDVEWPGWMFYASVHFAPTNSFWTDFRKLNQYVAKCQSFLQSGKPDNEILLYFPFSDIISEPGNSLLQHLSSGGLRNDQSKFRMVAEQLLKEGNSFDYISDKQIEESNVDAKKIFTAGGAYRVIIIPFCHYIPFQTFTKLFQLANDGARIIFYECLPEDIAGYSDYEAREKTFTAMKIQTGFKKTIGPGISKVQYGTGELLNGNDLQELLKYTGIRNESMVDSGIQYVRRKLPDGYLYFISNENNAKYEGYIPLNVSCKSVALFNPYSGETGFARTKNREKDFTEVFIQMERGASLIVRTYDVRYGGSEYPYFEVKGPEISLKHNWQIRFIKGGPVLPDAHVIDSLDFWTSLNETDFNNFSGTARYSVCFEKPEANPVLWLLDLGRVAESATVYLNGKMLATLISEPYQLLVPSGRLSDTNLMEIDVSNLMYNRIHYMESNGLEYRIFYNVNFPAKTAECRGTDGLFTALKKGPLPSGLEGPVTLTPVILKRF